MVVRISIPWLARFIEIVGVVCWICVISWALATQSQLPDSRGPLWSQDLVPALSRTQSGLRSAAGVTFFDDARLIVYAVSSNPSQLSSRKNPELSSAFRLHAWAVDTKSGMTEAHKEWGTRRYDSAVQATAGGVLVKTGGIVKLYSPDFAQTRDLPFPVDPNGSYFTSVSTSGQTIAVSHYFQKEHQYISHLDVLDARTLKVRSSWDQYPPLFQLSMSDERFVFVRVGVVAVTEFAHPESTVRILDNSKQGCPAGASTPIMISNELVVMRDCDQVLSVTASGTFSSLEPFNGRGSPAKPGSPCEPYSGSAKSAAASGGRFVALALPALTIKKPLLAESRACLDGLEIAVYDVAFKKRVLTVNVAPLPKNDYDFALSPDGSKLAVLNDRNVSVYSVPVRSTDHTEK